MDDDSVVGMDVVVGNSVSVDDDAGGIVASSVGSKLGEPAGGPEGSTLAHSSFGWTQVPVPSHLFSLGQHLPGTEREPAAQTHVPLASSHFRSPGQHVPPLAHDASGHRRSSEQHFPGPTTHDLLLEHCRPPTHLTLATHLVAAAALCFRRVRSGHRFAT